METSSAPPRTRTDYPGLALVVSFLISFAAAGLGSLLTTPNLPDWYAGLNKPAWNPPNAVFGPVWTLLFALMALAAWLVWRERHTHSVRVPLGWYALQLVLNVAWSGLFFALRRPDLAFLEILFLWAAILATLVAFLRVRKLAAALLVPYLLWVSFAAALNFALWRLNP